jgi:hypothetical protein
VKQLANKNTAAIYLRLSRDDGGDAESNSIGTQREMLTRYVKESGLCKAPTNAKLKRTITNTSHIILFNLT